MIYERERGAPSRTAPRATTLILAGHHDSDDAVIMNPRSTSTCAFARPNPGRTSAVLHQLRPLGRDDHDRPATVGAINVEHVAASTRVDQAVAPELRRPGPRNVRSLRCVSRALSAPGNRKGISSDREGLVAEGAQCNVHQGTVHQGTLSPASSPWRRCASPVIHRVQSKIPTPFLALLAPARSAASPRAVYR